MGAHVVDMPVEENQGPVAGCDGEAHLVVNDLVLSFDTGHGQRLTVLDIPAFQAGRGDVIGITGPSGAGKTSLLYVLTGIETPDRGAVIWNGVDIITLPESGRDRWRRQHGGFVFQDFHLVPGMTVLENVLLPFSFDSLGPTREERDRARTLIEQVGVPTARRRIDVLSRGERQRVALARALVREPSIIIADEPTAALDADNGQRVGDLLLEMARGSGATVLVVTHDRGLLDAVDMVYHLEGGRLAPA